VLRWGDLAAILRECADSNALSGIEQALARNVVKPLERAGFGSS
jgi:hypothetical protein